MSSIKEWLVDLNEEEGVVSSSDIDQLISKAELLAEGKLWIGKDGGPRPWWHRLLGTQKRYVVPIFSLEWHSDAAIVIFHDENWSEYRALKPEGSLSFSEDVRKNISHGEVSPASADECISKNLAFKAIKETLNNGHRSSWLNYKFIE